jgi:hypothetical protein
MVCASDVRTLIGLIRLSVDVDSRELSALDYDWLLSTKRAVRIVSTTISFNKQDKISEHDIGLEIKLLTVCKWIYDMGFNH